MKNWISGLLLLTGCFGLQAGGWLAPAFADGGSEPGAPISSIPIARNAKTEAARARLIGGSGEGPLAREAAEKGFRLGDPLLIRIFKQTLAPTQGLGPIGRGRLELWLQQPNGAYALFKGYPIAQFSGLLGPKLWEGDRQSPEGFYGVTADLMHPESRNHLALNVGYPNLLDQGLGHTGSFIMIHGGRGSVGCFAMTDPLIEEIYLIAEYALNAGQLIVPVHIFPFPLSVENLNAARRMEWIDFWRNLGEGYDYFETYHQPADVGFHDGRYVFSPASSAPQTDRTGLLF